MPDNPDALVSLLAASRHTDVKKTGVSWHTLRNSIAHGRPPFPAAGMMRDGSRILYLISYVVAYAREIQRQRDGKKRRRFA